jgi:hypothetical protein
MTDDERFEGAEGRNEELGEGYKWGEEPDLISSPEEELRVQLEELSAEERAISYRRPGIQGSIDLMRAELVRCDGCSPPLMRSWHVSSWKRGVVGEAFLEPLF